ncbi:T9SS type A sorting domain-containing protein [Dyadobacter flavalbus]|uniref:T9SS type A sorting domain-containing protein n=1 Tax=Dyadobacter flavalbus TaxID=2579942 RepID=A0A5M8QGT2_9BACT|nr:FG-GAP-like repeat-containing protein [Dyadobacter flavalbus]KAA6434140.1 T9SS type A sorting domain-containing protein [Dyadobacter flavalbus]
MKKHYRTGIYAVFSPLLVGVGYLLCNQEVPQSKSITTVIAAKKSENAPAGLTALPDIQQQLAKREYNISFDEQKSAMQSPNRRQGLRAYYKPGELTVQNRIDSAGHNFSLQLVNEGIYADGKKILSAQSNATLKNQDTTLAIKHAGFTEEFINNADGVRQNFIIDAAPKATSELQVRLSAKGLKVDDLENNELLFYKDNRKGERIASLVYKDIKCWDANGETLPATLSYEEGLVRLSVDVKNAAYPVTIDPIIANGNPANANMFLKGSQAEEWLGSVVTSAGDINGDGYSDVLACASKYDGGQVDEGTVLIYYGSSQGFITGPNNLEMNQKEARFGSYASSAGDINKDGYSDIVIGASMYDNGETNEGAVFVYLGSAQGINTWSWPANILECNQFDANMGSSVGLAGDVNGDGYSDILVGIPMFDKGQANEGAVFIYHGSATGLNPTPKLLEENQAGAIYGYRVNGAGDVNGDGYSDILVSAREYDNGQTDEGAVFVYHGSAVGIASGAAKVLEGNQSYAYMGHSVASAGDINGDGYSDIIIGANMYDKGQANEGAVFIHYGADRGIDAVPAFILEKNQAEAQFGNSVNSAGDVNDDGYSDVIVGALLYDNGQNNEGAAFVYHGSSAGLLATPVSTLESNQASAQFGNFVASAGDVNGDGYSDVIVGAPLYDNSESNSGAAFVWLGKPDSIISENNYATKLEFAYPNMSTANAGDVNGDGFSDFIVGVPGYNAKGAVFIYHGSALGLSTNPSTTIENVPMSAAFGSSVSRAGDVNGDGYGDIIVADVSYADINQGAALVYYGSGQGINKNVSTIIKNKQSGSLMFGKSVSSAGDVNGDGYGDVLIGDISFTNGQFDEGAVFVHHGSAAGINPIAAVTLESDKDFAQFGYSVSCAGDINGDGYADIIAGAPEYSNGQNKEGAAYVYYGAASGVSKSSVQKLEKDIAAANMGISVSGAGDVNGDGKSDVIVGANLYSNGQAQEGAAMIYYGDVLNHNLISVPSILESNQPGAKMGTSVSGAGDMNGDGYSDVIVNFPNTVAPLNAEGKSIIYYGSPITGNGIDSNSPSQSINNINPAPVAGSLSMNTSVAFAGDINGDGHNDLAINSKYVNFNNQSEKSICLIYLGNKSNKNLRNNLRLYNSDLTTIINQSQKAKNDFGAGLYAKSFLGGGKGKLVWETSFRGSQFNSNFEMVITTCTKYTGMQNSYSSLGLKGTELKNVIVKEGNYTRIRARVKYDPSLALTGQMYGPWRYVTECVTGNSSSPVRENAVSNMSKTIKTKAQSESEEFAKVVSIYPNPATDRLYIESDSAHEIESVQLLSMEGKSVYQSSASVKQVDVSEFAAGSYILVITHKDGVKNSRKVLITK